MLSLPVLCWLSACTPLSDLSSYSEGQPLAAGGDENASEPAVPPEIVLGPLQPVTDAGASIADAEPALDAALDAGFPCTGDGELVAPGGQGCYRFVATGASWNNARLECERWGGWLVTVSSEQEDDFLATQTDVDVWLGLSDIAAEGQMVWVDGEPFGYRNWLAMQPDNFGNDEDCVEKRAAGGGWNDRPCNTAPRAYFCER
jgi:lectin-like protein